MCGIFGIKYFEPNQNVSLELVEKSTDVMAHRGPDDSGYFISDSVGLGHRRLSIIDLSSGHQPMTNEDSSIVVVYNGEIYNFIEIKNELVTKGHTFRTNCDTEVIVHGYEEWGESCLQRFNGMFAFILFDKRQKLLWVVRDRLGIKPLYYYVDKEVFIASSEIKALLKTGLVKSSLNDNVLDAYFTVGYVPGSETMFKGIKKILAGHYLLVKERQGVTDHEYWDFCNIQSRDQDFHETLESVNALLLDCVQKRLISDVPVGAFLSGGLDSSYVVGLMSQLINPQPVNTFTVAYKTGYSEDKFAQIVADHFSTQHHVFYLEPDDFSDSLEILIRFAEEPIVEPAAIALYHISKLARKHATVLLSGEGSDEIFAGYYLYQFMLKIGETRKLVPERILNLLPLIGVISPRTKYVKYLDWFKLPLNERYQGTSSYLTPSLKKWLYDPDFNKSRSCYLEDEFSKLFKKVENQDPLRQMLYVDSKTWLVDELLLKADKMTMAASIELRVPFLDYRLIEYLTSLPADLKIRNGEGKYLLKKLAQNILPTEIVSRKKMGFPVPTKNWFQGTLMPNIESAISKLKQESWFQPKALDRLISTHKAGFEDHSRLLMTLLVFLEWRRQFGC